LKSIQIDRYGGPEVLIRRDIAVPQPAPGEVLIRITHAGVNFMDIHTREGKYAKSQTYKVGLPTTLGMEGAGEIVALGADVSDFKPGDRVAYCIAWGSYAEYAAVPASRVVNVPDALPLDMAAASVFHGFTAHYLAHDVGRLGPGVTCLVHAASGGIGQILIQLAKRLGATVFATTSTQAKADVARERGADFAVLYENGGFADAIRAATQGRGVDVVFDSIGKATLRDSLRATRKKGPRRCVRQRVGLGQRPRSDRARRSRLAFSHAPAAGRSFAGRGDDAPARRRDIRGAARRQPADFDRGTLHAR
jgi:NADPH2:quinone reductase